MMSRGRPIATANKKNAAYMLAYFNKLLTFPKEVELFFQQPHAIDEAKSHFQKVNGLATTLAELETFDQEVENKYHLAFAYWIDIYITETGFQRCLNGFHQKVYSQNSEKKTHIHIPEQANQGLIRIARRLGLSKHAALARIIEHAENTF